MTIKQSISKSGIALIQLRKAIQLYNKGEYVCALTLAGAANEVLGDIARYLKGQNTLDHDKWFWDGMAELTGKSKPSKGKIKQVNNRVKNLIKHNDSVGKDIIVNEDFEFEAQLHINSAIKNFWVAFDMPPKDRIINSYVIREWS